ncbi:MAG: hypothetical protein AYP45_12040 [Candidatus Brocadia carolinensis]|uniref:Uncharacterized protein n=1 Tax=Candidatus Brocadia carolinensis TaxID=1004156 RepID=A0A1V4ARZ6_9BACT|nr:MAG: hypothetical protein AYP45_12040 [Candidatus Brocadia caroliniensis]
MISILALDSNALFKHTLEIKKALSDNISKNILEDTFKKRGLLLEKVNSSIMKFVSIKEFFDFTDNNGWNSETNETWMQVKQELNAIVVLNEEITSLIKQQINDIVSYLEKIQEGRHFISTLKKTS